ncbi:Hypothetical protein NTJ_05010 [Nesidiocoris tenuis]|uniref:Uncharacterized protein n=1 Tax=Nesidiocoris tenuis TaxID=355587 RepID=A0ABN7AIW5_9HEMI|nr:Hypothetical protein NTJ_05010 [Nesidiocoris tenuis]
MRGRCLMERGTCANVWRAIEAASITIVIEEAFLRPAAPSAYSDGSCSAARKPDPALLLCLRQSKVKHPIRHRRDEVPFDSAKKESENEQGECESK